MGFSTVALFVFLSFLCVAYCDTGLRLSLSQNGLAFALGTAVSELPKEHFVLPAIPKSKFSCLGTCYLELKGGSASGLSCSSHSVAINANNAISLSLSGCAVSFTEDYTAHRSTFPSASCSGSIDASVSGISLVANFFLGNNSAAGGGLSVTVSNVATSAQQASVSLHGNSVCKFIGDQERHEIEKMVVVSFSQAAPQLQTTLQNVLNLHFSGKPQIPLPEFPQLRLSVMVTEPPVINAGQNVVLSWDGRVSGPSQYPAPECESNLAGKPMSSSVMLDGAIGTCVLNSLVQQVLALEQNVHFGPYHVHIPLPGMGNATVMVTIGEPGTKWVSSQSLMAFVVLDVTLHSSPSPTLQRYLVETVTNYTVSLSGQMLVAQLSAVDFAGPIVMVNATGQYNVSGLEMTLIKIAVRAAIPNINKTLSKGVTLPREFGFGLINDSLTAQDGYFEVKTDVTPKANASKKINKQNPA